MELFKVELKPGESVKDCTRCIYGYVTHDEENVICQFHRQWLEMERVKDGLICDHFNRKG